MYLLLNCPGVSCRELRTKSGAAGDVINNVEKEWVRSMVYPTVHDSIAKTNLHVNGWVSFSMDGDRTLVLATAGAFGGAGCGMVSARRSAERLPMKGLPFTKLFFSRLICYELCPLNEGCRRRSHCFVAAIRVSYYDVHRSALGYLIGTILILRVANVPLKRVFIESDGVVVIGYWGRNVTSVGAPIRADAPSSL